MAIRTEKVSDNEVAITLDQTFDFNSVEEFRRAYDNKEEEEKIHYLVDFKYTQYVDSSALGMLINLQKTAGSRGGNVKLANPSEQLKKLFAISRFDKKFTIQ